MSEFLFKFAILICFILQRFCCLLGSILVFFSWESFASLFNPQVDLMLFFRGNFFFCFFGSLVGVASIFGLIYLLRGLLDMNLLRIIWVEVPRILLVKTATLHLIRLVLDWQVILLKLLIIAAIRVE